jgi:hypothetical protein
MGPLSEGAIQAHIGEQLTQEFVYLSVLRVAISKWASNSLSEDLRGVAPISSEPTFPFLFITLLPPHKTRELARSLLASE